MIEFKGPSGVALQAKATLDTPFHSAQTRDTQRTWLAVSSGTQRLRAVSPPLAPESCAHRRSLQAARQAPSVALQLLAR